MGPTYTSPNHASNLYNNRIIQVLCRHQIANQPATIFTSLTNPATPWKVSGDSPWPKKAGARGLPSIKVPVKLGQCIGGWLPPVRLYRRRNRVPLSSRTWHRSPWRWTGTKHWMNKQFLIKPILIKILRMRKVMSVATSTSKREAVFSTTRTASLTLSGSCSRPMKTTPLQTTTPPS